MTMCATLLPGLVAALPCGKNRAFVDLGANDGQSLSWFEAELLHRSPTPYTSVTAFEMNPAFEAVLRQTLNRLTAGRLEKAAAWVKEGSMDAHLQLPGSRTATKVEAASERRPTPTLMRALTLAVSPPLACSERPSARRWRRPWP